MATNNNMYNLNTLIKRLEAATMRLEDIASSTIELPRAVSALTQTLPSNTATPVATTPVPTAPMPSSAPHDELPESIEAFDDFVSSSVGKFVELSRNLGGPVAEQAVMLLAGFKEQRTLLLISTRAKKPDDEAFRTILKPLHEALLQVIIVKESNNDPALSNQLNAVANGLEGLWWFQIAAKPHKHIEESLSAAQYYGNKVLAGKEPDLVEWVRSYYQMFRDLAFYVQDHFGAGIPWNPQGPPALEVAQSMSRSSAVPSASPPPLPPGAAPPPPPPPPPGPPPVLQINEQKPVTSPASGLGAVFSELNKGSDVTKGLRKVDKSEMTHKNPSLRASATVSGDSSVRAKSPAPQRKPKPESMRVKKPPRKELEGNKWLIENYEKEAEPIEIEAVMTHSVLISKCSHTTIIIKGKANAVTVENTQRLSLVVDSLVSTVDVVKSVNFALQVMGALPTILLDQLDGAQIYLGRESTGTRIFSSKSSGINLNVISSPDEDYKELPLPAQICSYFDEAKGDLVNEIVDFAG